MADVTLVGKIHGRNPTQDEMGNWVRRNWRGLRGNEPEITSLGKGWFRFLFNYKDDSNFVLGKFWNFSKTPFKLKKWSCLFDADTERLYTIPVWVYLPVLPWELWNQTSLSEIGRALVNIIEEDLSFM